MEFWIGLVVIGLMFGLSFTAKAAAIASLVAFGSIGFWFILLAVTIVMFLFIENENGTGATTTLLVFLGLQQIFGEDILRYICSNYIHVTIYILGYFASGTVWSVIKWWFHVKDVRFRYDERREKFIRDHKSRGTKDDWDSVVRIDGLKKPIASESKERILRWMTFWPWSMVWTLINDPIKKAFRAIFRGIQNMLQRISDRAFEGTEGDLE